MPTIAPVIVTRDDYLLTLEELAGWPWNEDDDRPQIFEADIDLAAEAGDPNPLHDPEVDDDPPCCSGPGNKWNPASWCGCQR
jgi:hypothetical protein